MLLAEYDQLALGHFVQPLPGDHDLPACDVLKPCEDVEQRGFAGTASPDDAADVAAVDGEIHTAQRLNVHAPHPVGFLYVSYFNERSLLHRQHTPFQYFQFTPDTGNIQLN